jgi:hypothetical protein
VDHEDLPDLQERLAQSAHPESQESQPSQSPSHPESQESKETKDPADHQDLPVHQDSTDLQVLPDRRVRQDQRELPAQTARLAHQAQQDSPEPLERRESARSTAPPMVESSSRTEPVAKRPEGPSGPSFRLRPELWLWLAGLAAGLRPSTSQDPIVFKFIAVCCIWCAN